MPLVRMDLLDNRDHLVHPDHWDHLVFLEQPVNLGCLDYLDLWDHLVCLGHKVNLEERVIKVPKACKG